MKKLPISIIALLILVCLSCKKYEEGPIISLRSKIKRVANEWKIVKVTVDGQDLTSTFKSIYYVFKKDGTMSLNVSIPPNLTTIEGKWSFANKKEQIQFFYDDTPEDLHSMDILMLTENEMKWAVTGTNQKNLLTLCTR